MEKRTLSRIQPFIVRCRIVHGARRLVGYVTDISLGGAQVSCDEEPPPVEAEVSVEIRFDRGAEPTRLAASVRWTKPGDPGHVCGLTFVALPEAERSVVEAAIARILRRADQLS